MTKTELCGSTKVPWKAEKTVLHHFAHGYLEVKASGHMRNGEGTDMVSNFLLAHITEPKQKEGCL